MRSGQHRAFEMKCKHPHRGKCQKTRSVTLSGGKNECLQMLLERVPLGPRASSAAEHHTLFGE
eukprot:7237840-Prorocentrum_lima.AAC.1